MKDLSNADYEKFELELRRVQKQGGTVEDVLKSIGAPNFFKDRWAPTVVMGMFLAFLNLFQNERWLRLAKSDRQLFVKELEQALGSLRELVLLCYDVDRPAHRPVVAAERDKEIFALKRQKPHLSFEFIGRQYDMKRTAATQAYKRHEKRESQRLCALIDFVRRGRPVTEVGRVT